MQALGRQMLQEPPPLLNAGPAASRAPQASSMMATDRFPAAANIPPRPFPHAANGQYTGQASASAAAAAAATVAAAAAAAAAAQARGAAPHEAAAQDGDTADEGEEGGLEGRKRPRNMKPPLQGRFSGRLLEKEDEKKLLEECKLLAPLVGGSGRRGEKSRLTLAKIVRGIASGEVRVYCQEREDQLQVLKDKVKASELAGVEHNKQLQEHNKQLLEHNKQLQEHNKQLLADNKQLLMDNKQLLEDNKQLQDELQDGMQHGHAA